MPVAAPGGAGPVVTAEPRVWFNPELRSVKFMVPGIVCVLLMESLTILTAGGPLDKTHIFATWAFRVGIEGSDIPLGASVSLFMVPILAVAAVFILRDVNKRGNES